MKTIIPLLVIPFVSPFPVEPEMITVNVNRVCASIVNIPYESSKLTDEQSKKFQGCRDYLLKFKDLE
jgi:hypothetical protein